MDFYQTLENWLAQGHSSVLVTVVDKIGECPCDVGKKMLFMNQDHAIGTIGGGALEKEARRLCNAILKQKASKLVHFTLKEGEVVQSGPKNQVPLDMVCGGQVSLFFDYIGPEATVYLFGAGHVGKAVAHVLKTLPFHVVVVDDRQEVMDAFPYGEQRFTMGFVDYIHTHGIQEDAYVVVCTPSHHHDYDVIHALLEGDYNHRYMGMLCSPIKLQDYLKRTYQTFGEGVDLSRFYAPIGLNLGGNSPEAIAVSIVSEILAIHHNKTGHDHMRGVKI